MLVGCFHVEEESECYFVILTAAASHYFPPNNYKSRSSTCAKTLNSETWKHFHLFCVKHLSISLRVGRKKPKLACYKMLYVIKSRTCDVSSYNGDAFLLMFLLLFMISIR